MFSKNCSEKHRVSGAKNGSTKTVLIDRFLTIENLSVERFSTIIIYGTIV